jgi:molybdopterin converting factor small subunit
VNADAINVDLPKAANVAELRQALLEQYPPLGRLLNLSLVAVNEAFASDEVTIPEGADVAIIPPVSGG